MIHTSKIPSSKRKEIESKAWKGVSNFDSQPMCLSDIYGVECDNFLMSASIFQSDMHDKNIINVGGGHGNEAEFLIRNGTKNVVVVDIAIGQLKSARLRKKEHKLDGLDTILGDAEALPFKDKVFDIGYIYEALHHFPDHNISISEICRVSREVNFVDIMNPTITRFLNFFGLAKKEWCGIEPNRLNEKDVKDILTKQKMDAEFRYFFIPPYYGNNMLMLQGIKSISKAINFIIDRSKIIASIFGNIAIIKGEPNEDTRRSGI